MHIRGPMGGGSGHYSLTDEQPCPSPPGPPCQGSPPCLGAIVGGLEQAPWTAAAHTCGKGRDVSSPVSVLGVVPLRAALKLPGHTTPSSSAWPGPLGQAPAVSSLHPFLNTASACSLTAGECKKVQAPKR